MTHIEEGTCHARVMPTRHQAVSWTRPVHITVLRIRGVYLFGTPGRKANGRIILLEAGEGVIDPWLVLVGARYPLTDNAIRSRLLPLEPGPCRLRFIGETPVTIRSGKSLTFNISFSVRRQHINELQRVYGGFLPGEPGHWLACRLLPRLRSSAIRVWFDPHLFAVYIPLRTPAPPQEPRNA